MRLAVIKIKSDWSKPYNNRGWVYYLLKDYKKAIEDFNKAISINSKFANAYHNRGLCYQAINENEKALADFNKAKALGYKN